MELAYGADNTSLSRLARMKMPISLRPMQIQYNFCLFTSGILRYKHELNPLAICLAFIELHIGNMRLTFQTVQDPSSSNSHSGLSAHLFLSRAYFSIFSSSLSHLIP